MAGIYEANGFTYTIEVSFSDEQSNSFDGASVDCPQGASSVDGVGQTSDGGTMNGGTMNGGTDGGMDGGM